ncbi:DUF6436 domain-containing protein [Thalassotalea piscium]
MTRSHFCILFVWISFTVLAFSYFVSERLVSFDSHHKLDNIAYQELSNYLAPYLINNNKTEQTILHFTQKECTCQQYSEQHIQDINKIATDHGFNIKNIIVDDDTFIPSTPSVALLDHSGQVIYFGPYGQGVGCSQTSGYAKTMLNNYLKGYSANIIIKEAKGCYCAV